MHFLIVAIVCLLSLISAEESGDKSKTQKRGISSFGHGYDFSSRGFSSGGFDGHFGGYDHGIKEIAVPITVEKKVPYPVAVPVKVPVPIIKHVGVPVEVPYPVKVAVPVLKPYPVTITKHVAVPVPKPVVVKEAVPIFIKDHGYSGHGFSSGGYGGGHGFGHGFGHSFGHH